jgi:hypothetical protein
MKPMGLSDGFAYTLQQHATRLPGMFDRRQTDDDHSTNSLLISHHQHRAALC